MSTFIESAACRGRRPAGLVSRVQHPRSDLIAKLLKDRHVARFLVAPKGYGKTSLAYRYADVVFSFNHVFWINAKSPCFLRDLDAGTMMSSMRRVDSSACLVVFEDVDHLDDGRAQLFAVLVDELLEHGSEVLVTCVPSCDAFERHHPDRLLLGGFDLMLNEEESQLTLRGERLRKDIHADVPEVERIACLRWGKDGARELALGIRQEELPCEMLLAMVCLMLLHQGEVDELRAFLPVSEARLDEIVQVLKRGYPHLGIEADGLSYRTAPFDIAVVGEAAKPIMEGLAGVSVCRDSDMLAATIADTLAARRELFRAMQVAIILSTKAGMGAWLARQGWRYLAAGMPLSVREAYASISRSSMRSRSACNALAGWAAFLLGDVAEAVSFSKRVAFHQAADSSDRILSCALLVRIGSGSLPDRARDALSSLVSAPLPSSAYEGLDGDGWINIRYLAQLAIAFGGDAVRGVEAWLSLRDDACDEGLCDDPATVNAFLIAASWLYEGIFDQSVYVVTSQEERDIADDPSVCGVVLGDVSRITDFVFESLERAAPSGEVGWCEAHAFSSYELASKADMALGAPSLNATVLAAVRRVETSLAAQREEYRGICARNDRQVEQYYLSHPNTFRNDARTSRKTNSSASIMAPPMHVNLFGSLEIRMDDEPITSDALMNQKAKTLLAILVLARGREMARDKLAQMLWPESSLPSARKNLYTTWSRLTHALSVEGSCPYLVRDQLGCRVNSRLVSSDVGEFEELCRTLLFGQSEDVEWARLYESIERSYSSELLPQEVENEYIIDLRDKYHVQLVDALIAAARRLILAGEKQGALWFAREALRRDHTREDAYSTLMEAQIAAGQRSAALETFFACRRYLSNELGIDPSPHLVGLYRSIIEVEEDLV